ncbi:MAG: glycogen/starch synthase, partial [Bacteroidales bacterium]|nr:glycogen/starch synthase [Bacteroidales bacterium]
NQLHEVIRLSGMNLIIDDADHPLIIKVASIQSARMQVYFIDNEDYFQRKFMIRDKSGKFFEDNDERIIFFGRGVIETVKKLGWAPDIVHCHGWFSACVPIYLKTSYKENPIFSESKIIFSLYNDYFPESLDSKMSEKFLMENVRKKDIEKLKKPDYLSLMKTAIDYSDAIILGSEKINETLFDYLKESGKPYLDYQPEEEYIKAYNAFYNEVMSKESILS